jgi:hypothetical protein
VEYEGPHTVQSPRVGPFCQQLYSSSLSSYEQENEHALRNVNSNLQLGTRSEVRMAKEQAPQKRNFLFINTQQLSSSL